MVVGIPSVVVDNFVCFVRTLSDEQRDTAAAEPSVTDGTDTADN